MANAQTVQALVVGQYLDLMVKLHELPAEISATQTQVLDAKLRLAKSEAELKDIEASVALNVEGKNADERKAKLSFELSRRPQWLAKNDSTEALRQEAAQLAKQLADQERQYGAVCYQSQLHAGLMNYLGNAGANIHVPEMTFAMSTLAMASGSNGHGPRHDDSRANATPDDAADIGL